MAEGRTSNASTTSTRTEGRTFIAERLFDAPRELVFEVWTTPEHLQNWWGPRDWTLPFCKVDLRPGGVWHYCMRGPEGEESWGIATYKEIDPPKKIVYVDAFSDSDGNKNEDMPEMLITTTFHDENGKTRISSSCEFATVEQLESLMQMGAIEGLEQTWDRLEEYLKNA
jgi:uncharacterized protein YndB with AHSA1/START domain